MSTLKFQLTQNGFLQVYGVQPLPVIASYTVLTLHIQISIFLHYLNMHFLVITNLTS